MESFPQNNTEKKTELSVNSEGKKYESYDGTFYYGGDYLSKPPQEINLDIDTPAREISKEEKKQQEDNTDLPPPTEINIVV